MERTFGVNSISDNEIQEYGKMISILSNRMISDREVAKEAAQEVWAAALKGVAPAAKVSVAGTLWDFDRCEIRVAMSMADR